MDKKLEKTLRAALDQLLQSTLENTYYRLMDDSLLSLVESKQDFLYGIVVGDMLEGLGFCTYGAYKRHPTDEEVRDLYKLVYGRAGEIEGRTRAILSK
jgi:hypothetical protein